jgi:BA14K-like protein
MRRKTSLYMTAIALAGSVLLAAVPASAQRGGHGGGHGPAAHVSGGTSMGGGRSFSGGANFSGRMSGGPSVGVRSGGNWSGGNWNGGNRGWNRPAASVAPSAFAGNRSFAFRDGRFHDGRRHFRCGFGPAFAFGYGAGYPYDYGYYDDLYAYSDDTAPDYAYTDTYAAGGDSASCAARFRSYDPASGTYLGYDGQRHPCP